MSKKSNWVPERGDIIWIDFNPQLGREMRDMHPMLVLSPQKFNARTGIVIGLPMTTAKYNNTNPFAIQCKSAQNKIGYVLTHQPKSFDWRERRAKLHPWKQVSAEVLMEACELLNQIITLTN